MKDKKVMIYFLLPLVIFIWGSFLVRLFKGFYPDVGTKIISGVNVPAKMKENNLPDTFSIIANYRDPFLGKSVSMNSGKVVRAIPVVKKAPEVKIPWPLIAYKGMMKNAKANKKLAVVSISGKSNLMNSGDLINGIALENIEKDSIEVAFQNETKWVKK